MGISDFAAVQLQSILRTRELCYIVKLMLLVSVVHARVLNNQTPIELHENGTHKNSYDSHSLHAIHTCTAVLS